MSRRYREQRTNSNYLPPLEPFPDDEEIFQPFDQHRLRDSLRLKKVSLKNSVFIPTKGVSDLETCIDYFVLLGKNCDISKKKKSSQTAWPSEL